MQVRSANIYGGQYTYWTLLTGYTWNGLDHGAYVFEGARRLPKALDMKSEKLKT